MVESECGLKAPSDCGYRGRLGLAPFTAEVALPMSSLLLIGLVPDASRTADETAFVGAGLLPFQVIPPPLPGPQCVKGYRHASPTYTLQLGHADL